MFVINRILIGVFLYIFCVSWMRCSWCSGDVPEWNREPGWVYYGFCDPLCVRRLREFKWRIESLYSYDLNASQRLANASQACSYLSKR